MANEPLPESLLPKESTGLNLDQPPDQIQPHGSTQASSIIGLEPAQRVNRPQRDVNKVSDKNDESEATERAVQSKLHDRIEDILGSIEKHHGALSFDFNPAISSIREILANLKIPNPVTGIGSPLTVKICPMTSWPNIEWIEKDDVGYALIGFAGSKGLSFRALPSDVEKSAPADKTTERLQRVQINSKVVIKCLEEVTGISLSSFIPLLLIPPFKLFVCFRDRIAEKVAELQLQMHKSTDQDSTESPNLQAASSGAKVQQETSSAAVLEIPPGISDSTSDKLAATKFEPSMLPYLETILGFIDTNCSHSLTLRNSIRLGSLQMIAFDDLWHLFRPGDLLFSIKGGSEQLYRAHYITGGRLRLRNRTKDEMQRGRPQTRPYDTDSDEDDDAYRKYKEAFGKGSYSDLVIDCYSIAFDGKDLGPRDTAVQISHYTGEKHITSLPIYPVRFHKDGEEAVRLRLRDRGKRYVSCYGHKTYDGLATIRQMDRVGVSRRGREQDRLEELQGDIIVDFDAFYRQATKPRLGQLRRSQEDLTTLQEDYLSGNNSFTFQYREGDTEVDENLAEATSEQYRSLLQKITPNEAKSSHEHLELLPYQVPAYILRSRRWAKVDIDMVGEFDTRPAAKDRSFEDLVVPEEFGELLVALVNNHSSGQKTKFQKHKSSSLAQIDVVRGKGRGLIILLHGPPGTGKTSTAETIASYTQRPLYTITCGDIGLDPFRVETELERHFELAHRWGAVLLLDEADVFLVARDWSNMPRNALVSIFLRHLEYYSGILFLTSNRVGDFDEAFKSRIHVALTYPAVDLESTKRIWEGILERISRDNAEEEVKIVFDKQDLLAFATKHFRSQVKEDATWNGRQIRNAFQTAIALGNYDRCKRLKEEGITEADALTSSDPRHRTIKLTRAKFAKIAKSAREFEKYMQVVQGGSGSSLASENNFRRDSYGAQVSYHQAKKVYSDRGARSREMSNNVVRGANRSKAGASSSRLAGEEHLSEFSEEDYMADEYDE
ncbi:hypothetical protein F4680DRAFT_469399 [Xylaria scruposa]|nr:hypothetical protein F4680DRAFT_469399 [Xylaria scruposa]